MATEYDELIKNLRICSRHDFGQDCNGCTQDRDDRFCYDILLHNAADAIEELQKQLREEKVDNVNLTGWLAEEHAKQCPHYIRNVHDRGDDSLCDKWMCEVKSLPKWIPVTERLPENIDEQVLVCTEDYGVNQLGFVTVAIYTDSGWLDAWLGDTYITDVTHWMPLPEPPKEG